MGPAGAQRWASTSRRWVLALGVDWERAERSGRGVDMGGIDGSAGPCQHHAGGWVLRVAQNAAENRGWERVERGVDMGPAAAQYWASATQVDAGLVAVWSLWLWSGCGVEQAFLQLWHY